MKPSTKKILIVLSAADQWTRADGSKYATGYWAEEFVVAHEKLAKAGFSIDIATPGGVKPTVDPRSISEKIVGKEAVRYMSYLEQLSPSLQHPLVLSNVNMSGYDAVIIPGGHGPAEDLYKDKDISRLLYEADKDNKIIGVVCHGPAALLSAVDEKGKWLFNGRKMTAFSDEEEIEFGTAANAPWLLASKLREFGAKYESGPNWSAYAVRDKNLISGQNPASTAAMADAILEVLT